METGLDLLATDSRVASRVRGGRVALLAHPASVTRELVHVSVVLRRLGAVLKVAFGPEHGYGGEAQDMVGVPDGGDADGARLVSLYGESFSDLFPKDEDLADVEVVVIDLQDVGARYYTFVWTAVIMMRACANLGVRVLILDRPNPLGSVVVEGRSQRQEMRSFVGLEPIPIRHGMTLGEIVAWRAEVEGVPLGLVEVVPIVGLKPGALAPHWDRPFVMPSPNMPSFDTALVYPGGCLLEGTNVSEGRGTTRPFEIVGAPWIDGARIADAIMASNLPGFIARPVTFRPTFHKYAGQVCCGVHIHVTDVQSFRPVATYLSLVTLIHHMHHASFKFRTEKYEFVDDIPAFDLLTGDPVVRSLIDEGAPASDVVASVCPVPPIDRETLEAVRAAKLKRAIGIAKD